MTSAGTSTSLLSRINEKTTHTQSWGQYGAAVSGGVEIMAFTATPGFKAGCTIHSYDGANAFNSKYHHRFLPALAKTVPSVVP